MSAHKHPPLPTLTRELNELADRGVSAAQLADEFRERAPALAAQIELDGRHPAMLALLG